MILKNIKYEKKIFFITILVRLCVLILVMLLSTYMEKGFFASDSSVDDWRYEEGGYYYSQYADSLVDTKVLVDSGVLAKPFKEQFEEVKQVVDRLADMTDNFTEVPASEVKQEEMFNLMRTYSTGMSKLKQYDPDVVNGEDIGFDYDNPDELVTLLGMTPEQEEMLTTSLYNDLKERIAENHDVPVAQIELRMIHVKQISVNYDYLTELIEALMNAVHEKRMDAAADYREKINDFAMALDDRQYAKQINNAVDAIYKGTYPPEGKTIQYPVKLTSLEVIEDVNTMIVKDDIFDFRLK